MNKLGLTDSQMRMLRTALVVELEGFPFIPLGRAQTKAADTLVSRGLVVLASQEERRRLHREEAYRLTGTGRAVAKE